MKRSPLFKIAAVGLVASSALTITRATTMAGVNARTADFPAPTYSAPIANSPASASGSGSGADVPRDAKDLGRRIEKALQDGKTPVATLKAPPQPKLLGRGIGEAVRTDFFTFFNLQPVDEGGERGENRTVVFKPSAPAFKPLVTVRVSLDPSRRIEGVQLEVARSFLDGPFPNCDFARDLVRSFLIAVLPEPDDAAMGDLIREINRRKPANVKTIASREAEPKLPEAPTQAFKAFAGETEHFQQTLSVCLLEIQNRGSATEPRVLRIAVLAGSKQSTATGDQMELAAGRGDAHAQIALGRMYLNGRGVPKDPAKRVEWLQKAAIHGEAEAQYLLGIVFGNGAGVPKDEPKAAEWLQKAALQGNAEAQFALGVMYTNGAGVSEDPVKAAEWYQKAAAQGYAEAQCILGIVYANGRGVPKDEVKAFELYRKAAAQGNPVAENNLGDM